jgi:hypothetical protein
VRLRCCTNLCYHHLTFKRHGLLLTVRDTTSIVPNSDKVYYCGPGTATHKLSDVGLSIIFVARHCQTKVGSLVSNLGRFAREVHLHGCGKVSSNGRDVE